MTRIATSGVTRGSYDLPDEVRTPEKTKVEVVDLGGVRTARFTMEPGWRWSECIGPIAGTDTCQLRHVGVVTHGHMMVAHGGNQVELGPGDTYIIEPGHDAWVLGEQSFIGYEFEDASAARYAAPE